MTAAAHGFVWGFAVGAVLVAALTAWHHRHCRRVANGARFAAAMLRDLIPHPEEHPGHPVVKALAALRRPLAELPDELPSAVLFARRWWRQTKKGA